MPTIRTEIHEEANSEVVIKDLDRTDELREVAPMHIASYQQRQENLHNRRVKQRTFKARELVLRRVFENTTNPHMGSSRPTGKDHTQWFEQGQPGLIR